MKKAKSKGWGQRWPGAGDLHVDVEPRILAAATEPDHFLLDLLVLGFRYMTRLDFV